MRDNELLAAEDLGFKFCYPKGYISFLSDFSRLDQTDWWLIGTSKGLFDVCFTLLNKERASKKLLIPFAKNDETRALACFDQSGKVYFYVDEPDLSEVNWDSRFSILDFDAWLERVLDGRI